MLTGEQVIRDMFYDGHPQPERGAITTRVAPTFLRFGHYEILAAEQELALLRKFADFTIENYFPELAKSERKYARFFAEVCYRTARLMVEWQRVGFVHGVMNTDNMSILGLTIDYGPYGWLDVFDPKWTPNTTDRYSRRYCFGDQPAVALWNLVRLAEALAPLEEDLESFSYGLELYQQEFSSTYEKMRAAKLGLSDAHQARDLYRELDRLFLAQETDMTIFYRKLAHLHEIRNNVTSAAELFMRIQDCFYSAESVTNETKEQFFSWFQKYMSLAEKEKLSATDLKEKMNSFNPAFILRNYLVQEVLDEIAEGRRDKLVALMRALKKPYIEDEATQPFLRRRPEWARQRAGCSDLSCSS